MKLIVLLFTAIVADADTAFPTKPPTEGQSSALPSTVPSPSPPPHTDTAFPSPSPPPHTDTTFPSPSPPPHTDTVFPTKPPTKGQFSGSCPPRSFESHWPVQGFEDCTCEWHLVKDEKEGTCVEPEAWLASLLDPTGIITTTHEEIMIEIETEMKTQTFEISSASEISCEQFLATLPIMIQTVKEQSHAQGVVVEKSSCNAPSSSPPPYTDTAFPSPSPPPHTDTAFPSPSPPPHTDTTFPTKSPTTIPSLWSHSNSSSAAQTSESGSVSNGTRSLRGRERKLATTTQSVTLTAYGTTGTTAEASTVEAAMKNQGIATSTTVRTSSSSSATRGAEAASFPVVAAVGASVGAAVLAAGLVAFVRSRKPSGDSQTQNEASEVAQAPAGLQML